MLAGGAPFPPPAEKHASDALMATSASYASMDESRAALADAPSMALRAATYIATVAPARRSSPPQPVPCDAQSCTFGAVCRETDVSSHGGTGDRVSLS